MLRRVLPLLMLLGAPVAGAQRTGRHAAGEVSASLFFGATQQQLAALRAELSREDSTLGVTSASYFRYGESADAGGVRAVLARSWGTSLTADASPFGRFSPFLFGGLESSYEQRVRRRVSGGAGLRWAPVRTAVTRASLSAALLAERLEAYDASTATDSPSARWSLRAKYDRAGGVGRVSVSHVTFYQPAVTRITDFRVTSSTRAAYPLTAALSFTLTAADTYESEARARGARSNHDGRVLVGGAVER